MHRVAVVAVPPVATFDMSVPGLILGNAQVDGKPGYEVRVCTLHPGTIETTDDLGLVVRWGLGILKNADTVIVTAAVTRWRRARGAQALQTCSRRFKRVASICTGAFTLAQAGLLDGRSATTYWLYSEELSSSFHRHRRAPRCPVRRRRAGGHFGRRRGRHRLMPASGGAGLWSGGGQ